MERQIPLLAPGAEWLCYMFLCKERKMEEFLLLVLTVLMNAVLYTWKSLVQKVIVIQVGIGAVFPGARVDVGVVVAIRADNQRTGTT